MVMTMRPIGQIQAKKALPPTQQTRENRLVSSSVTRREIEMFWRRKRIEEEDHLLAAIKAAARIRARNFTEKDYRRFEESLNEASKIKVGHDHGGNDEDETSLDEISVGIKDWWTKSKYAYLNQPATATATDSSSSKERQRRAASYNNKPNTLCFYNPPSSPLFPSSIGAVF